MKFTNTKKKNNNEGLLYKTGVSRPLEDMGAGATHPTYTESVQDRIGAHNQEMEDIRLRQQRRQRNRQEFQMALELAKQNASSNSNVNAGDNRTTAYNKPQSISVYGGYGTLPNPATQGMNTAANGAKIDYSAVSQKAKEADTQNKGWKGLNLGKGTENISTEDSVKNATKALSGYDSNQLDLLEQYVKASDNDEASIFMAALTKDYSNLSTAEQSRKDQARIKEEFMKNSGVSEEEFNNLVQYASYMSHYNAEQSLKEQIQNSSGVTKAALSVADVATFPAQSMMDLGDRIVHDKPTAQGIGRDNHNFYTALHDISQDTEESVLNEADTIENPFLREAAKFGYQTTMAAGKSYTAAMTGDVGLLFFGSSAYTDAARDAEERGLDDTQVQLYAITAGLTEMATEKIPQDHLRSMIFGGEASEAASKGFKESLKQIAIQMAEEGNEEAVNDVVNTITDALIAGDKSQANIDYQNYIANGMTEDQALKQVIWDKAKEIGYDYAVGAVSGGMSAGAAVGINAGMETHAGRTIAKDSEVNNAVLEDISSDMDAYESQEAYDQAQQTRKDVISASQNRLSGRQARELYRNVVQATDNAAQTRSNMIKAANEDTQIRKEIANQPDTYKAPEKTQAQIVEDIEFASTPYELAKAIEAVKTETDEIKELIAFKRQELVDFGANEKDVDNAITPKKAFEMGQKGEQVTEEQLKAIPERDRQEVLENNNYQLNKTIIRENPTAIIDKESGKAFIPAEVKVDGSDVVVLDEAGNEHKELFNPRITRVESVLSQVSKDFNTGRYTDQSKYNTTVQQAAYAIDMAINSPEAEPMLIGIATQSIFDNASVGNKTWSEYVKGTHGMFTKIDQTAAEKLYNEVREQARKSDSVKQENTKGQRTHNETVSKTLRENLSDEAVALYEALGKKIGYDFVASTNKDARGDINPATRTISIGANNIDEMWAVANHEAIAEYLQAHGNEKDLIAVQDDMLNYLEEKLGSLEYNNLINAYQSAYRTGAKEGSVDEGKSRRAAANEMFNDTVFALMSSEEGTKDFINWVTENNTPAEQKTILQRTKDFFKKIFDYIQNYVHSGSFNAAEKAALEMDAKQARELRKRIFKLMDEAIANANRNIAEGTHEESRFSKMPKAQAKLKQDITAVMNGKYSDAYVNFGETPAFYVNTLGLEAIPMVMTAKHVYSVAVSENKAKKDGTYRKNANYHNLGADILSKVPTALKSPALVIKSNTDVNDARFVSMIELYDRENHPIIAGIEISGKTRHDANPIDVNIVVSTYGKNNFQNYINTAIKDNRVLFVDKTKSQQIYEGARVQYPRSLLSTSFDSNLQSYKQIVNNKLGRKSIKVGDIEQEAIEHFGTTENFRVAGYMLADGSMLDFSGAHWLEGESPEYIADWKSKNDIRQVDHEDITEVYDDDDAYYKFVDERGNIRLMPESPGVSISSTVEPTAAQYRQLKEFIREAKTNPNYNNYDFFVDVGAKNPKKLAYRNNINEDRVINDIKRYYETGEISQNALNDFRYSKKIDTEYMSAVDSNDIDKMQQMVEQAAREAGFNSPLLYHGTKSFGFTSFDLDKMDDKQTIFLTSNNDIASTYSGTTGQRKISEQYEDVDNIPNDKLAEALNKIAPDDGTDTKYEYFDNAKIDSLKEKTLSDLRQVYETVGTLLDTVKDERALKALKKIREIQMLYNVEDVFEKESIKNDLSTYLYLLVHRTEAVKEYADKWAEIEQNIRKEYALLHERKDNKTEFIVENVLDGYVFETWTPKEARMEYKEHVGVGNYSLYARLGNSLEIDCKNANWNEIPALYEIFNNIVKGYNMDNTHIEKETNGKWYLVNDNGARISSFDTMRYGSKVAAQYHEETIQQKLLENIVDDFFARFNFIRTTRDVVRAAKFLGYKSVTFKNIKDNGGRNHKIDYDEVADVYAIFNPNDVKSADPVTYDNDGNVIPLSERFNTEESDLRLSKKVDTDGKELSEQQTEFFKDSKAVDDNGNLLVLYHGTTAAGFNEFRQGTKGGIWLTTSFNDADSYGGFSGKVYDPNEKASSAKVKSGMFKVGDFYFDTEEDLNNFLNNNPNAEEALNTIELNNLMWDVETDEDEENYKRIEDISKKAYKDYYAYEKEHFSNIPVTEIFENPSKYSLADVKRAILAVADDASFDDELDAESTETYKEQLIENFMSYVEDEEIDLSDIDARARIAPGEEGTITTTVNRRVYKVYANVENPKVLDAHGKDIAFGLGYASIEEALNDEQFDGVIIKNARQGQYKEEATLVIPKESNQIKLTSNANPTEDADIRKSIKVDWDSHNNYEVPARTYDELVGFNGTDEEIEAAEQQDLAVKAYYANIIHSKDFAGLMFEFKDGNRTKQNFLTRSTRKGYDWQYSYGFDNEPYGHNNYKDVNDVVEVYGNVWGDDMTALYQELLDATPKEGVKVHVVREGIAENSRNSFKVYGEASPYADSINESKVVAAMIGSINNSLPKTDVFAMPNDELLRIERFITNKYKVNMSEIEEGEIAANISYAFAYMQNNKLDRDYENMMNYLLNIGDEVIKNSNMKDPATEEIYNNTRKILASHRFKLSDAERAEISNAFGGSWKAAFGAINKAGIKLDNKNGQPVDDLFSEIKQEILNTAGIDLTESDKPSEQILALIDTMTALEPTAYLWEGANDMDKALTVVTDIVEQYYSAATEQLEKNVISGTEKGKAKIKSSVDKEKARLRGEWAKYKDKKQKEFDEVVAEKNRIIQQQQNQLRQQDEQMKKWNADLSAAEKKLQQSKILTEKQMRQTARLQAQQTLQSYKDRQERAKQIENIKKTGIRLIKWLTNPTDAQHVPEFLQKPLGEFLGAIDFLPKNAKADSKSTLTWQQRMNALREVLKQIEDAERNGENTPQAYFAQNVIAKELVSMMDEFLGKETWDEFTQSYIVSKRAASKVSKLDAKDLATLNKIMSALSAGINNMNKTYANDQFKEISKLSRESVKEIDALPARKDMQKLLSKAFDFANFDELEPITYFEGLGSGAKSVFDELRQGFNRKTRHVREADEYISNIKKNLGLSDAEISKWKYESHDFDLLEGKLSMNTNQIMSLYETLKRKQGKPHVAIGGVKVSDFEYGPNLKKKMHHQPKAIHISSSEAQAIINTLTDEQRVFADAMQQYMATECASWGNRVTEKMFGYKKYEEKDYFPLKTDAHTRATTASSDNNVSYYSIKNSSFTKPITPMANNAVVIDDIFDVFTDHVVKMADYDAYVMPIADAMRWFNYSEKTISAVAPDTLNELGQRVDYIGNMQESIDRVYGNAGLSYFKQFIKDINGDYAGKGGKSELQNTLMSMYKAQAVGFNMRVVIQQPTAVVRAADVIEPKYLIEAMASIPKAMEYAKKAQANSEIAYWKAQGYYETYLGQSFKEIITGDTTLKDKINDWSGSLAGKADDLSWGIMYHAAELKVQQTMPQLKIDSAAYTEAVVKIFEDIVDHTQVVDTIFHKSQWMRNKELWHQSTSAFMTEPTKTYNMLYRAYRDAKLSGDKVYKMKRYRNVLLIFLFEQLLNAFITGAWDVLRDDEKENYLVSFREHFKDNAIDNINPLNLMPIAKELVSAYEGWSATDYSTQGLYSFVNTVKEFPATLKSLGYEANKLIGNPFNMSSEGITKTGYGSIYQIAKSTSQITGIPFANAMREFKTLYNMANDFWGGKDLVTTHDAEKKQQTKASKQAFTKAYESNDLSTAKSAMQDIYDKSIAAGNDESEAWGAVRDTLKEEYLSQIEKHPEDVATINNRFAQLVSYTKHKVSGTYKNYTVDQAKKNYIDKWYASIE